MQRPASPRAPSRRQFVALSALGTAGALIPGGSMHRRRRWGFSTKLVHHDLRRLFPENARARLSKGDRDQGQLRTGERRQPANPVTTIAETGTGPEIAANMFNWPFLYDERYVDLSEIAEAVGKTSGGWWPGASEACVVDGKWKALPLGNVGQCMVWRTDWFAEAGFKQFPETWDELLEAGTKLKANGHPIGFEMGHGFGDNHGWLYPLLWSHGAHEVEADGRTVVIDSDETARAVDFVREFYQKAMFEDVLSWTDPSNNKSYLSEQISCTNNAESILWAAKRDFPESPPRPTTR